MLTNEAFDALTNDEKRAYVGRVAAAKDAEIARLRAELDGAVKERDASRLVSEGLHASNVKLRAELDAANEDLRNAREEVQKRIGIERTYSEINEELRSRWKAEREACDEARRLVGIPNPFDPKWSDDMRAWCDRYSARRAAEAKETQ